MAEINIEKQNKLTSDRLRSIIDYDINTGAFTWKVKIPRSKNNIGSEAGYVDNVGYRAIKINKILYKAHRLAFLWVTGEWPLLYVDHINGIRHDNRWCNLREATISQNQCNAGVTARNKLGHKNISIKTERNGRQIYRISVSINGKNIERRHSDLNEAIKIRDQLLLKHHGQFTSNMRKI